MEKEVLKIRNEKIVEDILDERIKKGKFEYLVKWKGCEDTKQSTWESIDKLGDYQNLINAFEKRLMERKRSQEIVKQNRRSVEKVETQEEDAQQTASTVRQNRTRAENVDKPEDKFQKPSSTIKQNRRSLENIEKKEDKSTLNLEETHSKSQVSSSKPPFNKTKKKNMEIETKTESKDVNDTDEVYNIESLMKKNGSKYLVKWENYSDEFNTWEPRTAIPSDILKVGMDEISLLSNATIPLVL